MWDTGAKSKVKVFAKTSTTNIDRLTAKAFIDLTKTLQAVIVHGYMEDNHVKDTYGRTRIEFKNWKDDKLSFDIWHVVQSVIQNLTRCIFFNSEFDTM